MNAGKSSAIGRLSAVISNDGYSAWIECRQADPSAAPPTMADIIATLEASRVSITPAVRSRVEEYFRLWTANADAGGPREVPSRYLVAEGTPPTEPQDDVLELEEQYRHRPSETGDLGTIDHFARSWIKTVPAGATIGRIQRGRPGTPGMDVFGHEIPPPHKAGAQISVGRGLTVTDSGAVLAEVAGRLVNEKQHLRIEPGLELRGDVDFDTGSLDACVDVSVRGTVKSGFRVRTTGSLIVGRAIEAAEIDVGGDLRVQGGICGREDAVGMRVGGGITARYCNESNVQAGGDVRIETETLNSRVHTPALFRSPGGTIIGGAVWAREGIEVSVLGSESGVTTSVAVGVSSAALREMRRIDEEMNGHVKVAAGIRKRIAPLATNLKRLTPRQRETTTELMCRADELDMAVEELQNRRRQLQERARPSGTPYILVNLAAYPGVRIAFGGRETRIDHVLHGPVRIEERKVERTTEIVAVNQRTASVTVLPSWEIDLSTS